MKKVIFAILLTAFLVGASVAQKNKPWTEWSKKDAEKILNDSAWGQIQTETNTSEMFWTSTSRAGSLGAPGTPSNTARGEQNSVNQNRAEEGAYNQATSIKYNIRFMSAKPIREALASMIVLQQGNPETEEQKKKVEKVKRLMQEFVDRDFGNFIVVSVVFEATDGRISGKVMQEFNSATAGVLKNKTYLETKNGTRFFLMEYRPPSEDGLGAKFVFQRVVDDKPILNADSGEVRFVSEVGPNVKLNRRFKISDMMYEGKLEY
jgi:hypothetical protein